MFKNYLKIAFRNLWKNKGYSAINIGGLAIGLAGFIIILLYADHELSYEKWNPNYKHVYRITLQYAAKGVAPATYTISPYLLGNTLKEKIPEIETVARIKNGGTKLFNYKNNKFYIKDVLSVDSTFFKAFPYKFIYGNPSTALITPEGVVLTKQTSRKLFGNENPVGKSIRVNEKYDYTVTGVCEKTGETHFDFNALIKFRKVDSLWQDYNYYTYILVDKHSSPKSFKSKIASVFHQIPSIVEDVKNGAQWKISLTPIASIHLFSHTPFEIGENGDPEILSIIVLLAVMLLVIACINFTNLSVVKSIKRAKEVGMRKVLGSSRKKLIYQFLFETFLQCLISLVLALIIIELTLPYFNNAFNLNLSIFREHGQFPILAQLIIAIVMVTLLSGIYPALFLSSFQPAAVLKGNFAKATKGKLIRKILIVFQFCISVIAIIGLIIVLRQLNYMKDKDIGFQPEQVLVIHAHNTSTMESFSSVKNRLSVLPNVKEVSYANFLPGTTSIQTITRDFRDKTIKLGMIRIGYDYFHTLRIKLLKGRNFSLQFPSDSNAIIINETAAKRYGLGNAVGTKFFENKKIIGIVRNFNQGGIDQPVGPMGFWIYDHTSRLPSNILIRIKPLHITQTIDHIKSIWSSVEPGFPVTYSFLDQDFSKLMLKYERMGKLFLVFTIIVLLIAMMGLFALAAFIAGQRTKEIGVRKILGASNHDILSMLNKDFLVMIVIANIIAWPITYILAQKWLNGFSYRIDVPVMPFVIATFFSIALTILVVSLQAWRAARANPVDALKYE